MASVSKAKNTKASAGTATGRTSGKRVAAKTAVARTNASKAKAEKPRMRLSPKSLLCRVSISYSIAPAIIGTPLEGTNANMYGTHEGLLYLNPKINGFAVPKETYKLNIRTSSHTVGTPFTLTTESSLGIRFEVNRAVEAFVEYAQQKVEVLEVEVELLGLTNVYHGREV